MFATVKKWILRGIWDIDALNYEIGMIQSRKKAETPTDIIRTNRIMDIEEDVIIEGFPQVVQMAYAGELSLDEYVYFIQNNCWGRYYDFKLPVRVDWNKVRIGINKVINNLLDSRKEGQQVHTIIGADNKEDFTEEEWKTYQSIEEFQTGNLLMFSNNKKLYVEEMQENAMTAFTIFQNKRFNVFDVEMAIITAEAYAKGNNFDKHQFSYYFNKMWKGNIISPDIRVEESLVGFRKLQELLKEQKENLQKNEKVFAVKHTEEFIKYLNEIIEKLNGNLLQAE